MKNISPEHDGSSHEDHMKFIFRDFKLPKIYKSKKYNPKDIEKRYEWCQSNIDILHKSIERHASIGIFYKQSLIVVNSGFGSGESIDGRINIWKSIHIPNFTKFKAYHALFYMDVTKTREIAKIEFESSVKKSTYALRYLVYSGLPLHSYMFYKEIYKSNFFDIPEDKAIYLEMAKMANHEPEEIFTDNTMERNIDFGGGGFEDELIKFVDMYNSHPRENAILKLALGNNLKIIDGNLYAYPQRTGSCAFHCNFWTGIFLSVVLYGAEKTFEHLLSYIKKRTNKLIKSTKKIEFSDSLYLLSRQGVLDLMYYHGISKISGRDLSKAFFNDSKRIMLSYLKPHFPAISRQILNEKLEK